MLVFVCDNAPNYSNLPIYLGPDHTYKHGCPSNFTYYRYKTLHPTPSPNTNLQLEVYKLPIVRCVRIFKIMTRLCNGSTRLFVKP